MTRSLDREQAHALLPQRPAEGHKGTFGHVFILAGSRGFTGACRLTCEAATRSGAGLVTAGVPAPLADVVAGFLVEAMSLPLPATAAESIASSALEPALQFAASKQAVVLGPGLSQDVDTAEFVRQFVRQCPVPLLVDADGLNALGADGATLLDGPAPRVITPHPGEMARLTGRSADAIQDDRETAAQDFAQRCGCTVVLKGAGTIVASSDAEPWLNTTGNAGLASGGTGDVLSGLIGGLMAQGMAGHDASALGVYLHGLAGDLAAEALTQRGMVTSDVIERLPAAWRFLERGS